MNEKEKDDLKIVSMRANQTRKGTAGESLALEAQRNSQILFKVGDLIMYDGNKTLGYIIEAHAHQVRAISEAGNIQFVLIKQINKKIPVDQRKMTCRDSIGNPIQVDNVVNVTSPHSSYNGQKGIIKNMTSKNILFLWDHKFMQRSAGIFTESAKNVTIRGHEYINNSG
jgi:hypothetical protein